MIVRVGCLLLMMTSAICAQTAPPSTTGTPSQQKLPTVQQTVEVTATRTAEDPEEVPVTVEVFSGDELAAHGGTADLRTALSGARGVDIAPGGDAGPASAVPEFWGLKEFDAFLLLVDDVPWGG